MIKVKICTMKGSVCTSRGNPLKTDLRQATGRSEAQRVPVCWAGRVGNRASGVQFSRVFIGRSLALTRSVLKNVRNHLLLNTCFVDSVVSGSRVVSVAPKAGQPEGGQRGGQPGLSKLLLVHGQDLGRLLVWP